MPLPDSLLIRFESLRRHLAIWRAAWAYETGKGRSPARHDIELAFLPAAVELAERPSSPFGRGLLWLTVWLFSIVLAWSWFGKVDIHATAQGRIIAAGKTKPISAPETASVAAIHVADGDHVTAGQVLIDLDTAGPGADSRRLLREWQEMQVSILRLRALLDGRNTIQTDAVTADLPADLIALHQAQLRQKLASHAATIHGLEDERAQRQAEKRGAESDKVRLEKTVPLLEERQAAKASLSNDGYVSRTEYLQVRQEYLDRSQELDATQHKLAQADAAIANVGKKLSEQEAQFRAEVLSQLAESEQKAASLSEERAKADDRQRLYHLTAPVAGVVQQLSVHAPGAMVSVAQPVMMIVPENVGIAVEAMLESKDAGFVIPGQDVEIKVEAFPFTRYGTIAGKVETVSGDAVQSDSEAAQSARQSAQRSGNGASPAEGRLFYAVRVQMTASNIHADGKDTPLAPGMAVTAEVKTGKRRVLDYVLDSVKRHGAESLTER